MKKTNKSTFTKKQYLYFSMLILFNVCIMNLSFIFGNSMNNTLYNGDIVLVYKLYTQPHYKDIIITNRNNPYKTNLIKRIIATEGQRITIKDNTIFVDYHEIREDYIKDKSIYSKEIDMTVPKGKIFVMGDNRNFSKDSREIGCLETKNIKGKVVFRILPIKNFGKIY